MSGKSNREIGKSQYQAYEKKWLETHSKDVVDKSYCVECRLHCKNYIDIEDTSNYFVASVLACALYSKNDGTDFFESYLDDLYQVLPKDKVDAYVYGGRENESDTKPINYKYNELDFVNKFRKSEKGKDNRDIER